MNPLILLIISLKFKEILKDQLYFITYIHLHFLTSLILIVYFNIVSLNLLKFLIEKKIKITLVIVVFNLFYLY